MQGENIVFYEINHASCVDEALLFFQAYDNIWRVIELPCISLGPIHHSSHKTGMEILRLKPAERSPSQRPKSSRLEQIIAP